MTKVRVNRRRNRIVDAPRQTRFVFGVTAVPMGLLLAAAIAMWLLAACVFDEVEASNADLPTLGTLVMTQFLFIVFAGAAAIWEALRYSNRVVGPAHRLAAAIRRLRAGETGFRIDLRSGDEMRPIAEELNAWIAEMPKAGAPAAQETGAAAAPAEPSQAVTNHAD